MARDLAAPSTRASEASVFYIRILFFLYPYFLLIFAGIRILYRRPATWPASMRLGLLPASSQ
jgi:hypothetical protein